MRKFYLSKNYNNTLISGNKAKTDIEKILSGLGYKNAGLAQTTRSNKALGFLVTLVGVLKVFFTVSENDWVVLQYPLKKYYAFVCRMVHLKKGKVITVVHDLGAFRRKKLTTPKEIKRLSHTDVLIVHNQSMNDWLQHQGYMRPMVNLEIFDYLSDSENDQPHDPEKRPFEVIYAGGLSYRKNKFLYDLDPIISGWQFDLYGKGFESEKIKNKQRFRYHGFCPSDQLIRNASAHFGLVWEGDSVDTCAGNFGAYLKINNPHKVSLYIRCNLPLIIWSEAALAPFVTRYKIGLCIRSLHELEAVLTSVTAEAYREMTENLRKINEKIASGYFFTRALHESVKML
jgi:hypothetical protein